jgi:HK97 family phage portal protein
MRISTLFACILVRGESLSTLPASVLQSTPEGSRTAYENPVYGLIHRKPNPFQTACDYWKSVSAHIDNYGNAFSIITYSGRFQPTRIDLIKEPDSVEVLKTDSNQLYYRYKGKDYQWYEILHFKDLSLDGYMGVSRIRYNAEMLAYAKKLKQYGSNAIGVKPPGYFSTEATYDVVKKAEDALSKTWKEKIAEGSTPLIPFGLKYNNLQINPGDAQYLDSIEATKEDICAIMRVPPTLVQNYQRATFANAEQQDLVYVKYTMLPLITNIEQECNAKLFSEANATSATPYYVKFNVNAFMRGDFKTRTEGYRTLFQSGMITGNQVADFEDWNHYEGGEKRFIPMNMIPLDKLDAFIASLTKPVDSTAGNPGGNPDERKKKIEDLIKMNGYHQ